MAAGGSSGQRDPAVLTLGTGRLPIVDEHRARHRGPIPIERGHAGPQGHDRIDRGGCQELERQRGRAIGKVHRLGDVEALVSARGGRRRPDCVADDGGRDHASLETARQPDVKGLRLPSAHDVVAVPPTLDLKTLLVQAPTSIALPIDEILKGVVEAWRKSFRWYGWLATTNQPGQMHVEVCTHQARYRRPAARPGLHGRRHGRPLRLAPLARNSAHSTCRSVARLPLRSNRTAATEPPPNRRRGLAPWFNALRISTWRAGQISAPIRTFSGADDGIRTRDPHLGKVTGTVRPVRSRVLTWPPVLRSLHPARPVRGVRRARHQRAHAPTILIAEADLIVRETTRVSHSRRYGRIARGFAARSGAFPERGVHRRRADGEVIAAARCAVAQTTRPTRLSSRPSSPESRDRAHMTASKRWRGSRARCRRGQVRRDERVISSYAARS